MKSGSKASGCFWLFFAAIMGLFIVAIFNGALDEPSSRPGTLDMVLKHDGR